MAELPKDKPTVFGLSLKGFIKIIVECPEDTVMKPMGLIKMKVVKGGDFLWLIN
jgi:hypothetical protein